MMFELFTLIIILAVVFFLAGFHFENYPTFILSGLIFLILAGGIYGTGLTMKTGEIIKEETLCPAYINDTCLQMETYNLTTTINYQYESSEGFANTTLGTLLLAMSFFAFGCALIYATPKEDRDNNNPDHEEWNYY